MPSGLGSPISPIVSSSNCSSAGSMKPAGSSMTRTVQVPSGWIRLNDSARTRAWAT